MELEYFVCIFLATIMLINTALTVYLMFFKD
jgi:hypothetical protein